MGGKKATSTSQVTIPPEVLARYNAANKAAETAAASPYHAFGNQASDYVAQINPQQTMGITGVNTSANSYQPYLESATGTVKGAMGGLNPEDIQRYMSPYVGMVAGSTAELMKQANEQAQSGALGAAASSGAFGGDRAGIAAANLNQQNQLAMGKTMADIYNQGYGQAVSTAQQQQGVQLQGAQLLSGLGAQAQGLGLQGAQAQLAAGTMQQQTEQAGKDAMIKSFMQEKGYPFQTAQFLANIAMGTGALSGSTTTSTQPTGMFGFFRDGGKVDGYAGGGGVSGPMSEAARGFDEEGYVPAGLLPVGQLMVANPPDQQRSGGLGNIIKLASTVSGFASGGVAGGRHGYDNGGQAEDEARLAAARAAVNRGPIFEGVGRSNPGSLMDQANTAAAIRNPSAPSSAPTPGLAPAPNNMPSGGPGTLPAAGMPAAPAGVALEINGEVWRKKPNGSIVDESGNRPNFDQVEYLRNIFDQREATADMLSGMPRIAQSDLMADQFRQVQEAHAQRNRDALVGMYEGNFPVSGLAAASQNMPSGGPGTFPVAGMPAAVQPGLGGPGTFPAAGMPADMGRAALPPPARPTDLGAAPAPVVTPTAQAPGVASAAPVAPVPGGVAPAAGGDVLHDTYLKMLNRESGGRHTDANGNPIVSERGAVGIGQIMEATGPEAARLAGLPWDRERWMHDASYNAAIGEAYFRHLYDTFGSVDKAVAAYNGGPGRLSSAIDRATALGGSWLDYMPEETKAYVPAVLGGTGAAPPAGLGAANASSPPQPGGVKPYAERNAMGQFFRNPDGSMNRNAILSLLSGIGHMAEARTVSPIGALLSGVGAGADTYANLQKQAADIALQNAQTRRTGIITAGETGGPSIDLSGNRVQPLLGEMEAPGVSLPYQVPKGMETVFSTPDVMRGLQLDNAMVYPNSSPQTAAAAETANAVQQGYATAKSAFTPVMSSFGAAADLISKSGPAGAGAAAGTRANLVAAANMVLSTFGYGPVSDLDANAAILKKVASAAAAAGQGSNPSVEALMNALNTQGDAGLPPEALASITAQNLVDRQIALEKGDFYQSWGQSQGIKSQTGNATYLGAEPTFNSIIGQKHNAQKAFIEQIMLAPGSTPDRVALRDQLIHLSSGGAGSGFTPEAVQAAISEAYPGAPSDLWKVFFNKGLAE